MKLIGKGAFTKAYLKNNGRVLLSSCDPVKECMSLGYFPNSKLFPVINRISPEVYDMKYYPKVSSLRKSLTPKHFEYYKLLRQLNGRSTYNYLYDLFSELPNPIRNPLLEALYALSCYGRDICFEISPRNVAVTKKGRLILLDCFFFQSALAKRYSKGN